MTQLTSLENCTNVYELERMAKSRLTQNSFDYYIGGATDEITIRHNLVAYQKLKLRPRMLRDISNIETSIKILDCQSSSPILIAPMAFQKLAHKDGEVGMVKSASKFGTIMTVSTLATCSLEEVAEKSQTDLWFQLYVYKDKSITKDLLERAYRAGYKAIVVTVDSPVLGKRERDIKNKFSLEAGMQIENLVKHFQEKFPQADANSGLAEYIDSLYDRSLTWKDLTWISEISKLPVLVKGILRDDDALLAIKHGANGIIVSNHGGRQLDTTISTIEALPEVVAAVDGQVPVVVDGGIRRGTDVLKSLALGANAVLLGRPLLWGLALDGSSGAYDTLNLVHSEFLNAMALSGCAKISEITKDLIYNG